MLLEERSLDELSKDQQRLVAALEQSLPNAYAPYSHFPVSAALLLANGNIITGTNQENAAYPSGLCAERVALFHKGHQYPDMEIVRMAVTVGKEIETFPFPCGACLQVMAEFQHRQTAPIEVMMYHRHKKIALLAVGVEQLLPFAFIKEHLGKT